MIDILAIGAHIDDVDFALGGILVKMASQGKSIAILDISRCDKGTHGDPEERKKEGLAAAALIGATRDCLEIPDCEILDDFETRLKLIHFIREKKPKLVIGPSWTGIQTHPDHITTGKLVRHACRFARYRNILPEVPMHQIDGVLHYPIPGVQQPEFMIDISDHVDTWKKMMLSHESQMKTYDYSEWLLRLASAQGVMMGCNHAQGLIKGNPIIIDDVMTISKGTREL